jgi:hypothetical protein
MTHVQHCEKCRYVGLMDYVHGHFVCPKCKQQIAFGDCCQGSPQDDCEKEEDVPN